ncbi:MAG: hypothetical protein JXQ29_00810 [Planctomycetes bacterium]|nr:hypothetical protein [Planctomycetota bacterium]
MAEEMKRALHRDRPARLEDPGIATIEEARVALDQVPLAQRVSGVPPGGTFFRIRAAQPAGSPAARQAVRENRPVRGFSLREAVHASQYRWVKK